MDNPFRRSNGVDGSFLPTDYVRGKHDQRTNVLGLVLFAVVMLGVCGAFVVTNREWKSVREEQRRIGQLYDEETQKIDQLKALEAQRAELVDRAEVTTALVETTPRSVLLGELTLRLPEGASLTDLTLESKRVRTAVKKDSGKGVKSLKGSKKGESEEDKKPKIEAPKFDQSLKIVGVAEENGQIADYLTELKACVLFESVEVEFIKETRINKTSMRKFEMVAMLQRSVDVSLLAAAEPAAILANPMAPLVEGETPLDEIEHADDENDEAVAQGDEENAGDPDSDDEPIEDVATVDPEEG